MLNCRENLWSANILSIFYFQILSFVVCPILIFTYKKFKLISEKIYFTFSHTLIEVNKWEIK